jgi:hypothetical protein
VVEDGNPGQLALDEASRFCAMLKAERAVTEGMWASAEWRHLKLERGELTTR